MTDGRHAANQISTWEIGRRMLRYAPGRFAVSFVLWAVIHASPLAFGFLIGIVFDTLTDGAAAGSSAWTPVLVFFAVAVGRNGVLWIADFIWIDYWLDQGLQIRRNLLRWLLEAPGSRMLPSAPGEAISNFRDDVDDLLEYIENYVDFGGVFIFSVGAVVIMATIDATLTGVLLVPLLLTVGLTQALSPEIRRRRRAMRIATERVTGFVGETFSATQSIKLSNAESPVMDELRRRNETRRVAALRDTFLTELLRSINVNMANVGSALVLILAAGAIRDGSFTVGDLAVFLTYLPRVTGNLAFVGDIIAQYRRTGVAYERLRRLSVDADDDTLLDPERVPLTGELGAMPPMKRGATDVLRRLEVRGLSFTYLDSDAGIHDVSFTVERNSFIVITGKIGSGKTTVLRSLLGLLPAEGDVVWNGDVIGDRASFLVPPRSAYTPQVPRLFSDSLAMNIALAEASGSGEVEEAAAIAVLERDINRLAGGIDTLVGARGVKLSGGQIQRSAAARMFATHADLLVFDDLSSALDLHTEAELWKRLFTQREVTCLVVSHRPAALARASEILVMDEGRIVDRGSLDELLERSEIMRELSNESSLERRRRR